MCVCVLFVYRSLSMDWTSRAQLRYTGQLEVATWVCFIRIVCDTSSGYLASTRIVCLFPLKRRVFEGVACCAQLRTECAGEHGTLFLSAKPISRFLHTYIHTWVYCTSVFLCYTFLYSNTY